MKRSTMLTIASLLSIVFLIFHMTDDILREGGMAVRGIKNGTVVIPVLSLWLYGALALAGRKSGYIIMLVGSLIALGMPFLHMALARKVIENELARTRGDYLFVWMLLAVGVTGLFSLILSVRCLKNPQWGQSR